MLSQIYIKIHRFLFAGYKDTLGVKAFHLHEKHHVDSSIASPPSSPPPHTFNDDDNPNSFGMLPPLVKSWSSPSYLPLPQPWPQQLLHHGVSVFVHPSTIGHLYIVPYFSTPLPPKATISVPLATCSTPKNLQELCIYKPLSKP